jgi:hypothetical protein
MPYAEAVQWVEYMRKRGSLNVGQRVEAAIAVLSTQVNRALGGKAEFADFAPHWDQPEPKLEDIATIFGAVKRTGNG